MKKNGTSANLLITEKEFQVKKRGAKFTDTEREGVLAEVAKLDRRGWSQHEIAWELKVSQPQISQYLKRVRGRYKESQQCENAELVELLIEQYREVAMEAWRAWERSKENLSRVTEEEGLRMPQKTDDSEEAEKSQQKKRGRKKGSPNPTVEAQKPQMLKVKITRVTEGRLPASNYLSIVQSCLQAIRELKGLDAPKKVDVRQATIDWREIAEQTAKLEKQVSVEEQLAQMLGELVIPEQQIIEHKEVPKQEQGKNGQH